MAYNIEELSRQPNKLADHYTRFAVSSKLLMTGHSHQAWPDIAFEGVEKALNDAANLVDDKWENAFLAAERVREGFSRLLNDDSGYIALASNTHELLIRFLSALPLKSKPKILTSDGEFHTIRRQLTRLEEEGVIINRVESRPVDNISERVINAIDNTYSAVLISSVFFESGLIAQGIELIADKCNEYGIPLLIDSYHSLNVVPFDINELRLQNSFIIGGGYKYCQLGEGNCFLRFPKDCNLRPIITGWFSEFTSLSHADKTKVHYGTGADLFAGSTYDPISHYRAAEVFRFFNENELHPKFLRQVNQRQIRVLINVFLNYDLPEEIISIDNTIPIDYRGGFLVFQTNYSDRIYRDLKANGVLTDFRGTSLRFGPAPYLSDKQLTDSIGILAQVVKKIK